MFNHGQILKILEAQTPEPRIDDLKAWLAKSDTRLVSSMDARIDVSEAQRLWSTRLKNTDTTGKHLAGVTELLLTLQQLAPRSELEQFAFKSPDRLTNLLLLHSDHTFVGAVSVAREPGPLKP